MKKLVFISYVIALTMLIDLGCTNRTRKPPEPDFSNSSDNQQPTIKPTINVYVENSGSMEGYVKGATEFKNSVYSYLSDIKISGVTDSMNLFYINSEILPQKPDIQDFIEKLDPTSFREKGGKRGISDIAKVIGDVLNETRDNDIAILVTDGIFSPGRGVNADEYLINQQIGIKMRMSDYLRKFPNTAVVIYQLSSNFDGNYYNKVDAIINLNKPHNKQRPFYLWVNGDAKQVSNLRNKVPDDKFKGSGVQNVFTAIAGNHPAKYALNSNIGNVRLSRENPKTVIRKLRRDRYGKVRFGVNVDFSDLLLDDAYLSNPQNYETNCNYVLEIEPYKGLGFTHTLYFTSDDGRIYKGVVSVKLKTALSGWIESVNDDDGSTAIQGKTYGIKYQLEGIFEAFTFTNNYYTEIKITIN